MRLHHYSVWHKGYGCFNSFVQNERSQHGSFKPRLTSAFVFGEQCDSETHKYFFLHLQALFIMLKAHYHFNFYITILINCYWKKSSRFELCVVLESFHGHHERFFPQRVAKYSVAQLMSAEPQDKGDKTTSSLSSCSWGFLHLPLKTQLEMDAKIHRRIIRLVSGTSSLWDPP